MDSFIYKPYLQALRFMQLQRIVHPKCKILSSFTHPHVIPNLYEFLSSEDILKYADSRTVVAAADLHSIFHAMESMDTSNFLGQLDNK